MVESVQFVREFATISIVLPSFCGIIVIRKKQYNFFPQILIAKELVQMMIRNNDELKLFEETLDRCDASVMVVTAQGEQYDLMDPAQRYMGIAVMLTEKGLNEPELFASSYKDEMELFRYLDTVEKKIA